MPYHGAGPIIRVEERHAGLQLRERDMSGHRRWVVLGSAVYIGILAVVAGGLTLLYRDSRERLDEALGQRLSAVASTAVYLVEGDSLLAWAFDPEPSVDFLWLASRLEQIQRDNDLAELSLCDPDAYVLISASGRLARGDRDVFWDLDRPAVDQAREGFPAVSKLYRIGAVYQKSAHAPVFDSRGDVAGVLTVEGNVDFFDSLATLRHGALVTIITVVAFLTLLSLLLLRVNRSLARYRASLLQQESLAAMGRMTAGIAHEIRNPLGIIRGTGQHLARVLEQHGIADEAVTFIPEEVDRLDRILTGYLAFGSDAAGVAETVDLSAVVHRTVRLVASDLEVTGVTVALGSLPVAWVRVDPRRLQQVLLNLLLNARDAMPDGGEVSVAVSSERGRHIATVSDRGTGMAPLALSHAFEPFWTSKEKGGGLGLAVSRRLMREAAGDLDLADRPDPPGAVATLWLPSEPPPEGA